MAFYPCSNSVPTQTYSISRNGTYDMGQTHKYRYVTANVLPTGGVSYIYRGEFPGVGTSSRSSTASVTFTASNNYQYLVHFRWVAKENTYGWESSSNLVFGGSARYWTHTGTSGQSNLGGVAAYNASTSAYIIGNGSNVSVTWTYRSAYGGVVIDIYQINW